MIIFDIEASGTDPFKHSIVSIGALNFEEPHDQFYGECKIWDGAHIDPDSLKVNGFSEEQIKDPQKISESELVKKFTEWACTKQDHTLAGMNPLFDITFLRAAANRTHLDFPFADRSVDLHSVIYTKIIESGNKPPLMKNRTDLNSDKIMNYVGINPEPHPHNALNGALWEAEAFHRLFYGKNLLEQFKDYPVTLK